MKKKIAPIRAITHGPKFHWFGYYDKLQFEPTQRYVLGMETDFEHRRPDPNDVIKVGMVDLANKDAWIELGESRAWCWQTGCMLQWRPGTRNEIMWNDRENGRFICHILDVNKGFHKTLPFAFFTVHPDGKYALGLDFERLEYMRPGYGYAGVPDKNSKVLAPKNAGIYHLNLETGEKRLIISLADITKIPHPERNLSDCKHYFNCLLFNPEGSRFVFLHRWRAEKGEGWPFKTRMISANPDGSDIHALVPKGCGHFNWRDAEHLIVQADGFSIYKDRVGKVDEIGKGIIPSSGGHVSYLPGNEWLVGDTYADEKRYQHLYLYHIESKKNVQLGSFNTPVEYTGSRVQNADDEWRCDLHPRQSPDGKYITIDSVHGGNGRQIYLIDIKGIVDQNN
jgi:hypothetical protein